MEFQNLCAKLVVWYKFLGNVRLGKLFHQKMTFRFARFLYIYKPLRKILLVIIDLVFGTGAWRFLNLQTGVWRLVIRIFLILAHRVLQCARIMKIQALLFVSARRKKNKSRMPNFDNFCTPYITMCKNYGNSGTTFFNSFYQGWALHLYIYMYIYKTLYIQCMYRSIQKNIHTVYV